MNRVHYIVYWKENIKQYITTTPREWARQYGENHGLDADARTQNIENYLKSEFRFIEFTYDDSVVLCHLETVTPIF